MKRESGTQPRRLLNEQYMELNRSFNIFVQQLTKPSPLHWHEFYEMCVITEGTGTNVLNGVSHPLERGSLFLLTPADFHEVYPDSVLHIYNVIFSEDMLVGELRELLLYGNTSRMIRLDHDALLRVEQEYRVIDREVREPKIAQRLMVKGALERILIELLRQREISSADRGLLGVETATSGHVAVANALPFIHHHFREPLRLQDAAREANLAPGYFSTCFRQTTGHTFQHYLQNLRLEFGAALLLASDRPVTDICYASGFRTLTHFERVFRSKYGCSPRQYQQQERRETKTQGPRQP
ncbi:helix-turn-helix domain-containing protein [Paenibacillus sp. GCM10012303]|jgi:AraC-like DNA-binding protein|uniref:helix-turn-helix domain-containing protein n=1 Tax=Paenibacillus sp. GCM10012303 TaxID=3317340 RepID=UPI00361F410B